MQAHIDISMPKALELPSIMMATCRKSLDSIPRQCCPGRRIMTRKKRTKQKKRKSVGMLYYPLPFQAVLVGAVAVSWMTRVKHF